ncbi:MAG TPA: ABC transporter permease subunit [Mycobacteriales bacterium]|nr:ABC transporter permease subunit [Mycobacteriales bacterium]
MSAVAVDRRPVVTSGGSTLPNVTRSEWTKLVSVRSTRWTLLVLAAATIGFGILFCFLTNHYWPKASAHDKATFDPTSTSFGGLMFGQLAIAVLGVMAVSSEYSTGGIRTSLTAVPNRMRFLAGKLIAFTAVSAVVGLIVAFVAFFASQPFFAKRGLGVGLGDPDVLRAVIGAALYIVASGLFGFAIGTLLRHTAGAITTVVAFMFVLPLVVNAFPGSWGDAIIRYFTSNAGQQITYVHQSGNHLGPWLGFGVYCIWFVVPLIAGAYLLQRRDS